MDRSAAEDYVRDLFRYVLDREAASDAEVDNWVNELLTGRSAPDVFNRFAHCEENNLRWANRLDEKPRHPNGHFYSPVVNISEVTGDKERIFGPKTPAGVDLNEQSQVKTFSILSQYFAEMPFSDGPDGRHRYHYNNTSYAFGDACIYWGMLGHLRPNRIIEIGSGFTSALALDAIDHFELQTRCTFIDPNPQLLLTTAAPIGPQHEVIAERVQTVDPTIIEQLEANDLLFIDSSHVVKTGSDVHFELTEMLSRLRPGAMVHFHDIFYPFEYPHKWVVEENYSWNELYYLHAFLMYNSSFEIIYFNDYFKKTHSEIIQLLPQTISSRILLNAGGGLWLRRR